MNILEKAHHIVYERGEERERQYGPFHETMEAVRDIYNAMQRDTSKHVTTEQVYHMMIAMKLAREGHAHKEDNLLDACAYMASLNDYVEERQKPEVPVYGNDYVSRTGDAMPGNIRIQS